MLIFGPGRMERGVAGRHHHKSHHSLIDFQFLILIASSYGLKHKKERKKKPHPNKSLHASSYPFDCPKQFHIQPIKIFINMVNYFILKNVIYYIVPPDLNLIKCILAKFRILGYTKYYKTKCTINTMFSIKDGCYYSFVRYSITLELYTCTIFPSTKKKYIFVYICETNSQS